jgi:fido (protein-threonine AMPylation protein)
MMRNKEAALLQQLSQEGVPISLSNLLKKLGKEYAERSVRRWLAKMVADGRIEMLGRKRSTKYQIARKDKARTYFGLESTEVIRQVQRPLYERTPVAYAQQWFDAYKPNITFYTPASIRSELYKMGKRSKSEEPAGTYARQIFNRLLIELSYNSSRLEGNTYSLLDTEKLILEGTGAEGKLEEEKVMILNHKEAIRYLVDTASRLKTSVQTICTLHYLLSDGLIEPRYAGKVRDHGVRIGGSTYVPFEDAKRLQRQLGRIAKKAALIKDPYEQSLFLLVHITYLQAFSDVNKRTARLSANIPLVTHNLVPLSFNDIKKDDYISAVIAIYELQDVRPLVDLYAFSYMRTCAMYDSTVKAIGFDEVRVRYRQQRRALVRYIILHNLHGAMMKKYISIQAAKLITKKDRDAFVGDVLEDLEELDQNYIAGLGITVSQLESWRQKKVI